MADSIPQELFEGILLHLTDELRTGLARTDSRIVKRDLGAASLTCKYWARNIRPLIFRTLVIYTRDDALALRAFLKYPSNTFHVSQYMRGVIIETTVPEHLPPWIHLLLHMARRLIPPSVWIDVRVFGSGDKSKPIVGWRSIYRGLPRTLPLLSARPHSLSLIDTPFTRLQDLHSVIRSSGSARTTFTGVTWDDHAVVDPMVLSSTGADCIGKSQRVRIMSCSDLSPILCLAFTTRFTIAKRAERFEAARLLEATYVQESELECILSYICDVHERCACPLCAASTSSTADGRFHEISRRRRSSGDFEIKIFATYHAVMLTISPTGVVTRVTFAISATRLTLGALGVVPAIDTIPHAWIAQIDAAVHRFSALEELRIQITHGGSLKGALPLARFFVSHLPYARAARKLVLEMRQRGRMAAASIGPPVRYRSGAVADGSWDSELRRSL